ncbi:MAG: branched-chain amino acid ABC transporter permease [Zoogloeaceae bacterium]|nr:branched-chain amino acid ABC transporter permease [Zoogloeaceae bacterium]
MDLPIALILGQDGIINGAIYALLALAILLVFTVTRVLMIPQGEFVAFGALTMAALQAGQPARLVWLLAALAVAEAIADLIVLRTRRQGAQVTFSALLVKLAYPFVLAALLYNLPTATLPMPVQAMFTLAIIVPMGPQIYRLFFQPIASAPSLILLIAAIAVDVSLVGVSLFVFGPESASTAPFSEASFEFGSVNVSSQALWVVGSALALIVALWLFFSHTLHGKALRAAAVNRTGATLMGISPVFAGKASFLLATLLGALSGILIAPITPISFDSGFVISLKGFVGAIIGGLISYPLAAAGALAVGLIEAFAAFWASSYKEVIVFTLIIPFLLWRSLTRHTLEEEE